MSKLEQYPIPQVEDLLSALAGGKSFTKLNITQAYQQLCLDEESQKLVVIDTHKELFKYKRVLLQSHPCRQKIGWERGNPLFKTSYIEIKVSLWLLCGVQHLVIMAEFIMYEKHNIYYNYYFDYFLFLLFRGSYRTLGIYCIYLEQLLIPVSTYS